MLSIQISYVTAFKSLPIHSTAFFYQTPTLSSHVQVFLSLHTHCVLKPTINLCTCQTTTLHISHTNSTALKTDIIYRHINQSAACTDLILPAIVKSTSITFTWTTILSSNVLDLCVQNSFHRR
jgi:hypothetical protein